MGMGVFTSCGKHGDDRCSDSFADRICAQILTPHLPYASKARDPAIRNAIIGGELPANIPSLKLSAFIKSILEACWQQDPGQRPKIAWCLGLLSAEVPSLFRHFLKCPLTVPGVFKVIGNGWQIVHNPDSERVYSYEAVPHANMRGWCVPDTTHRTLPIFLFPLRLLSGSSILGGSNSLRTVGTLLSSAARAQRDTIP